MLVEIYALRGDDIRGVDTCGSYVNHDGDKSMLLNVEGSRVQRPGKAKHLNAVGGQIFLQ